MIRCPSCKAKISIIAGDPSTTPLSRNLDPKYNSFRVCWVAKVGINCPECGKNIPDSHLEDILPSEFLLAEGAKVMRSRNPHRLNPKSGSAAANVRWAKKREREAWESFNKGTLTWLQLNELLEEIGIPADKRFPPTPKNVGTTKK